MRAAIEKLFAGLRVLMIVSLAAWAPLDCCCPAGAATAASRPASDRVSSARAERPAGCPMCERPAGRPAAPASSTPWSPRPCPHGGPSIEVLPASAAAHLELILTSSAPAPMGTILPPAAPGLAPVLAPVAAHLASRPPPPDISLLSQRCMLTV